MAAKRLVKGGVTVYSTAIDVTDFEIHVDHVLHKHTRSEGKLLDERIARSAAYVFDPRSDARKR